jgi:phosphoenolpyruvate carboxykinase (GTP)
MELRVHNEVGAVETPTGRIPRYEDLERLFKEVLNRDYSREDYSKQFMIRIPENLGRVRRARNIYGAQVSDTSQELFEVLNMQEERLNKARQEYGDCISPDRLC